MLNARRTLAALVTGCGLLWTIARGAEPPVEPLSFEHDVRPILRAHCFDCHSDDVSEADVNLAAFADVADARRQTGVWIKVREMLDSGQMPPKDAPQPSEADRERLRGWVRGFLAEEARAHAGDPGPVVLRRLSNAEYTWTIQDLTGVDSLEPARDFPVDGAAGEGFTNTGYGQGMSPALVQKYLDAAKSVADHAVLLPDGIRFSRHTSRRDQTDELVAQIRAFYGRFTEDGGGRPVDLQGIKFETNQGGLLPLEKYLAATLAERDSLASGTKSLEQVARERSLSVRYLQTVWEVFTGGAGERDSFLIDNIREKWRPARVEDAAALAADIAAIERTLWRFNSVGHIGREGGPKSWMEAVSPITSRQELRVKLPPTPKGTDIVLYLAAHRLDDGAGQTDVVWQRPRLEFPAGEAGGTHPPIPLREIRRLVPRIEAVVAAESVRTKQYLDAVARQQSSARSIDEVARAEGLNPGLLAHWAALTGFGSSSQRELTGHFTQRLERVHGYEAINGWGRPETPSLLTNRSDEPISFQTLTVPARGVTVHPSPERESVVGWRSPVSGRFQVEGLVADADDKCGNGAGWRVERRSRTGMTVLAEGTFDNGGDQRFRPDQAVEIATGDVVALIVSPRDGNHACDTTHINLKLSEAGDGGRVWDLAGDAVDRILDGNPLPDSYGNAETWHFCESEASSRSDSLVPPGSALARWRAAVTESADADQIGRLAAAVQDVLTTASIEALAEPDRRLRERLLDWKGPLDWVAVAATAQAEVNGEASTYGLDPERFGRQPRHPDLDDADLCVSSAEIVEVRLPANLAAGAEFVATAVLAADDGQSAAAQLHVLFDRPKRLFYSPDAPILVNDDEARQNAEAALDEFRNLFPPALCYERIVPVDEVVTLTLFYREDDLLKRLMLTREQSAELDRLWDELYYVSQEPLKLVVAFEQISEFATQDRPDLVKAFAPMRERVEARAEAFRGRLIETEPAHLKAALEFADRAWRRPLDEPERQDLRELYQALRDSEIAHEDAVRLVLARVLTAPAFLYKLEQTAPGPEAAPVTDLELAARLSYFLWSSTPDDELRQMAEAGRLTDNDTLRGQTRRMLEDPRTRRLAIQFACQWLHLRDFDQNDDKNESLYPEFATLRRDMYEETVRFFEDMFRNDGSILGILEADHTFLNEPLATHYGISGVSGDEWQRVTGMRAADRGGILGMATFLASQSGASRTSPILRGNWVYETLLGERLPRPPADVPQLPEAVPEGLTERQLIERHSADPACAKCHVRIDPFGFALEQFDTIGRRRPEAVDTATMLDNGRPIEGLAGLRDYLAHDRRDDVVRQFCRKLLGYALGREVQLSDEPLLAELQEKLAANDFRFSVAVEAIVTSPQFRRIRGEDAVRTDSRHESEH
jgi:hypothetical protein